MSDGEYSDEESFENERIQRCIDKKNNFLNDFNNDKTYNYVPDGKNVRIVKMEVENKDTCDVSLVVKGLDVNIENVKFTIDTKLSRMDYPNGCLYFFDTKKEYRLTVDVFSINSLFTFEVRKKVPKSKYDWEIVKHGFAVLTKEQYDNYKIFYEKK